ncbi:MAG: AI-2E family transporter [Myxococcales bacterium]
MMRRKSLYRGALVLASGALVLAVALPLWQPLLVAAVLAAGVVPWHDRLSRAIHGRRQLAAALFVAALVLLVLVPLAWVVSVAVREAIQAIQFVRTTLQTQGPEGLLTYLPGRLAALLQEGLARLSTGAEEIASELAKRGLATAAFVGGAVSATAQVVVQAVFLVIAFYFFLLDGRRLVGWLAGISPAPDDTQALAAELRKASRSVLASLFLTALVQAFAATAGYLIAGVPNPVFFGLLTFLAAFIPSVGTTIVALPLAGLVLALGHPWSALFLASWALLVVGLIDNVVKPLLIKEGVHLDGAVLFFALIGGLALFGAVGLLVGPLAVASFVAVVSRQPTSAGRTPSRARERAGASGATPPARPSSA